MTFVDPIIEPVRLFDNIVTSNTQIRLSLLEGLNEAEMGRQMEIVEARRFHEGDQAAKLTERLEEFLGGTQFQFRLNVCMNVVTAVTERLDLVGFDSDNDEVLDYTSDLIRIDGIDAKQEEIYEYALRDGEYFVIVDWDTENGRPTFIPIERYTSLDSGGNGMGCIIFYEEDDPNQKPQLAIKQWMEYIGEDIVERRNLYYPDRIEKWVRGTSGEWEHLEGEDVDWTDENNQPLGIAVIHFRNKGLRPAASDAIPMQRAVNKSLLDLLASSDMTAFRIYVALGFIPTSDGQPLREDRSNLLPINPGQVVGTTIKPGEADFKSLEPANLEQQMDLTHQLILWLAMTSNTPVSRFISTKLIASDETLKEQEGPLLARVQRLQTLFGNSWVQCMKLAIKMQNAFGSTPTGLDPEAVLDPIWGEAQSRSVREKLELLKMKQELGIPTEQLWREAGYSSQQIKRMQRMAASEKRTSVTKSNPPEVMNGDEQEGREVQTEELGARRGRPAGR
jgi:hypothetical protein